MAGTRWFTKRAARDRDHFRPLVTGLPGTLSLEKALAGLLEWGAALRFQGANAFT
jgi:hypothetical protein